LPQVAVSVCYHVGAADEPASGSGLAHLFEHLFKNSEHLQDRHHYDILRSIGATDANASTGVERTSYHQVVPAHQLEVALWLESDRMGYFAPAITQARLAAQQQVVRSELRQRYENVPYGAERFAMAAALYPPGHPLHTLVIGRHHDIEAVSLEGLLAFYRTWYVPANAHLVIAGDVEPAAVRRLVGRYFGSFPASVAPPRRGPEGATPSPTEVEVQDRFATLERLHLAWRGPTAISTEATALEILGAAWAQPGTGALWKRLVYQQQLAQRVSAWTVGHRLGTEFHVTIDLRTAVPAALALRAFSEELAQVRGEGLLPAALERVLARREAAAVWGLQRLAHRASELQRGVLRYGDPNGLVRDAVRFAEITPGDVRAAAERWLAPDAQFLVHTAPGGLPAVDVA
jgi:zinc protease